VFHNRAILLIYENTLGREEKQLQKKKQTKNLLIIRILATVLILSALVLPYFDLMSHSSTPLIILVTIYGFFILENNVGKRVINE